ncbi:MAG: hypothetical protein JO339_14745 [Alphaproteobacteria bacterium]|nr:hypothetical protein [Alphaproteobacteria bacterium]
MMPRTIIAGIAPRYRHRRSLIHMFNGCVFQRFGNQTVHVSRGWRTMYFVERGGLKT